MNQLINESFNFLRYLNEQDAYLLTLYQEHLFRKNPSLYESNSSYSSNSSEIKIRIGEVVENKNLGYRGVCINWTIEPSTNLQLLTLLIDWYDFEQILHGSLPIQFYANEFHPIRDHKLTRVHHNMISDYFLRYDSILGIYIPKYSLSYTHPYDSQYLFSHYQKNISHNNNLNEIHKIKLKKSYLTPSGYLLLLSFFHYSLLISHH